MKGRLTHFLIVGVPGICFVIVGAVNNEYAAVALGAVLTLGSVYELGRKGEVMVDNIDQKRQRRSFVVVGVIGASFAITGFVGHGYWLGAAATVILIGALLQLYRTMHAANKVERHRRKGAAKRRASITTLAQAAVSPGPKKKVKRGPETSPGSTVHLTGPNTTPNRRSCSCTTFREILWRPPR